MCYMLASHWLVVICLCYDAVVSMPWSKNNVNVSGQHIAESSPALCMNKSNDKACFEKGPRCSKTRCMRMIPVTTSSVLCSHYQKCPTFTPDKICVLINLTRTSKWMGWLHDRVMLFSSKCLLVVLVWLWLLIIRVGSCIAAPCMHASAWPYSSYFPAACMHTLTPVPWLLIRSHGVDGPHPTIRREEEFDEDRFSGEYYSGEEFYEDDSMLSGDRYYSFWIM